MIKRNSKIVKEVLLRDVGLCRCCGFKASEVHHITPLIFGGKDETSNMISLCSTCHRDAPNTKEEFFNYMKSGGARTFMLNGKLLDLCEQAEIESKGVMKFQEVFFMGKKILLYLKKMEASFALERYNFIGCKEIQDVDFSDCVSNLVLNPK